MTVTIQLNAEDVVSFYQNNSTHTISKCAKCAVAKGKNCKENKKTKQKKQDIITMRGQVSCQCI